MDSISFIIPDSLARALVKIISTAVHHIQRIQATSLDKMSNLPLQGKAAIVTGSSRGIGAGIALDLARKGANVLVHYTSPNSVPAAEAIAQQVRDLGRKSAICKADLTDLDQHQSIIDAAIKNVSESGKIEILVHNAAVGRDALLKDTTVDFYNDHVNCNIRGLFFLTQKALPHLAHGGRIVIISSVRARLGVETQGIYSATKAAGEALARVWAKELGHEHGITVNCVNPGPVATDQWRASTDEFIEAMQPIIKSTPAAPRVGEVEDIAPLVSFLCTEEARWVTGSVLSANGGLYN
ncbi:hypothetical protein NCS55_01470800 [Fusarium keratoplasticum]|nr:hypothetical protein NCS55_01470800 [Fusarium keratoplasticum]